MDPPGSLNVFTNSYNDDAEDVGYQLRNHHPVSAHNVEDELIGVSTVPTLESAYPNTNTGDFMRLAGISGTLNSSSHGNVDNDPTSLATSYPIIFATVVEEHVDEDDPPHSETPSYPPQRRKNYVASRFVSKHMPIEQMSTQQQRQSMMANRLVAELKYPPGLAKRLVTCVQTHFVKHYWLVDNSGSMLTTDCFRMVQKDMLKVGTLNIKKPRKLYDTVKCSRWNELEDAILSHIKLASILEVPTTFRLLRGRMGTQEFSINLEPGDVESAESIIRRSKPDGDVGPCT